MMKMKIRELSLRNFRSHQETNLALDRINLFVGANGAGKSTIKNAIEFALTGKCDYTDERGVGANDLIYDATDQAVVSLIIDDTRGGEPVKLSRMIPGGLSVEDWHGTATVQQEQLYEALGAKKEVISAVLNTSRFITMSAGEQKNLLFSLLGMTFTKEIITERITKEYGKDAADVFLKHCEKDIAGGAEQFDALYKTFFELRKLSKKKSAEIDAEYKLEAAKKSGLVDGISISDKQAVIKQLEDLRASKTRLEIELDNAGKTNRRIIALNQQKAQLDREAVEISSSLAKSQPVDVSGSEAALADAKNRQIAACKEKDTHFKKVAHLSADINHAQDLIKRVKSLNKACVLAPDKLPCPNGNEEIAKLVKSLEDDLAPKLTEHTQAKTALDAVQATLGVIEKQITDLNKVISEGKTANFNITRMQDRQKSVQNQLQQIATELEQLGTEVDITETETKIRTLVPRISRGELVKMQIETEEQRLAAVERLKKQAADKKSEVNALEKLVLAFGPSGLKQTLLKEIIGPIQEHANQRIEMLTKGEFTITFDINEDFQILVAQHGRQRKVKDLSRSEQMRIGIILQDVLNSLTGLGLMVIDDAEAMDPRNKMLMMSTLLQLEDYGTIIVLAARGETEPRDPGIPGLAVFLVEKGSVRSLKGQANVA
jgi:exonuclease SbcC